MPKIIWVRTDHLTTYEERKKATSSALEAGYVQIVIRQEDKELKRLGRFDAIVLKGKDLLLEEEKVGELIEVSSNEDLKRAYALKDKVEHLMVEAKDWRVIPLENLIAEFQKSRTKIMAVASTPEEAKLFLATLEVGVSGVVLQPSSPSKLKDFQVLREQELPKMQLSKAVVSRIAPAGVGDRVCVDTCSMLRVGEGMLVGSQSACLFLVCSESLESEYVASRPFRVNAGAVHAYILTPSGKTRYLSEIRSGDEVLAVDSEGRGRAVVVGRAKIERRPLLLVEVKVGERRFTTILQNAETIRLCSPQGPISISDLKPGQEILVKVEEGGRHFGQAITETITEL
ncbi:MAG: 3-dehydroquinate synthase II [Methanomassiliicoccales archaeon]